MKTYSVKAGEIQHDWFVVDATDQVLGRLATRVASVLRGKHKPTFSNHLDVGDYVVVVNAQNVRLDGTQGAAEGILPPQRLHGWRAHDPVRDDDQEAS